MEGSDPPTAPGGAGCEAAVVAGSVDADDELVAGDGGAAAAGATVSVAVVAATVGGDSVIAAVVSTGALDGTGNVDTAADDEVVLAAPHALSSTIPSVSTLRFMFSPRSLSLSISRRAMGANYDSRLEEVACGGL